MLPLRLKRPIPRNTLFVPTLASFCLGPLAMFQLVIFAYDIILHVNLVTMQAQKEAPHDMQCRDKFLLQSVAAPEGATTKDITADMFNKEDGKVVEESKLGVVYIPANPPSPVLEESEEGSSPRASVLENDDQDSSLFEDVSRSCVESKEKSSEVLSMISKLTEEKASALRENQKLRQEVEKMRKQISKNRAGGYSSLFVLLVGSLGILVGYLMKRT
ncbi:vesicle-associated protein 1-3 isoform X2 [Manihot esculenta]|uniref:MSP domain-containing protein n=1 Tax=Manihot esculenta TaxID=3983 RepID=A0A2C9WPV8_MANES|nr:vesicle-associated protein 1-3 isoform X2 [Manihot esculenta]XP_043805869.1 vesicle-associated protein 1-3 isoform X2 [Manihot esculenta]OAY62442.1 hypothetical protein MANES_01G268500v8 [Manihot esculenta]